MRKNYLVLSYFGLVISFLFLINPCFKTACADWSSEIVLWEPPAGITASHPYADIVVDAQENAHVVYSHIFRNPDDHPTLSRVGFRYMKFDDHGQVLVSEMFISDSTDDGAGPPIIRLFDQDSLWILWSAYRSNNPQEVIKYTSLDLNGHILTQARIFTHPRTLDANQYCFDICSDKSVVVAYATGYSDTISLIIQRPDGSRPIDQVPIWTTYPCEKPTGAVDHTDSLELIWGQIPSWQAVFGKRISTSVPLDPSLLGEHVEHTPRQMYGPYSLEHITNSLLGIVYWHWRSDGMFMTDIALKQRSDYSIVSLIEGAFVGEFAIEGDSVLCTLGVDTNEVGRHPYYYRYRLPDLEYIEHNLIARPGPYTEGVPHLAIAVSPAGVRHVAYQRRTLNGPTTTKYVYCYWRSDLASENRYEDRGENEAFTVFPNPTNGDITINGPVSLIESAALFNILGQRVRIMHPENRVSQTVFQFHTDGLGSGQYFLQLITEKRATNIPVFIIR